MLKNYKFYLILAAIGLVVYFFIIKPNISLYEAKKENDELKKEILAKDTLQKLSDGKYAKLVNNFSSASDLNKILSDSMKSILDTIKNRNERTLFIDQSKITFKSKTDTDKVTKNLDSTYSFTSYYPQKDKYFIQYSGNLNTKTKLVKDNWSFANLNLNIVVTERKDGLWDSYIDGPSYLKVNSVKVNSLPADKYVPVSEQTKTFGLYGGLGLRSTFDGTNPDLLLKAGLTIKDKVLIDGDFGTDKKAGIGVLIHF